jgi:coproporphyrinogen III oxidase-like Fe-S oxidoreductase
VRDWDAYRARVLAGEPAEESREELTAEAAALERVWLGLRTSRGLSLAGLTPEALALARAWQRQGLAELTDDRVRLTSLGWLELDRLAVEMDSVQ